MNLFHKSTSRNIILIFTSLMFYILYLRYIRNLWLIYPNFHANTGFSLFFLVFYFFLFTFPMCGVIVGLLIANFIPFKIGRWTLALIVPAVQVWWFFHQVKFGQGPPGYSSITFQSRFSDRLYASLVFNGPLIICSFLVVFLWKFPKFKYFDSVEW